MWRSAISPVHKPDTQDINKREREAFNKVEEKLMDIRSKTGLLGVPLREMERIALEKAYNTP